MVSLGWAGLDPAQFWDENSSLGLSIPYTTLGQVSAHPNEAMNSIKLVCWTMGEGSFSEGVVSDHLRFRPDPAKPLKHGFIEPAQDMLVATYQDALAETRDQWRRAEE